VRIIRAYRIAAELNFRIEKKTRKSLKLHSRHILKSARERISEEFFKILSLNESSGYIRDCHNDNVLEKIILSEKYRRPGMKKIISQNINFSKKFDLLELSCSKKISRSLKNREIVEFLDETTGQGLNRRGLIRLFLIFKGLPVMQSNLCVSGHIQRALQNIHKGYIKFMELYRDSAGRISGYGLFRIFQDAGDRIFEVAVIVALMKRVNVINTFKKAEEFKKIRNKVLLNGNEVKRLLDIKSGIQVGRILSALKDNQLRGFVKTKAEARKWVLSNYT
jgi:tRNA nucleotidyltransferase/poly(A) polymerase